jgi:hypothetical protein
MELLTEEQLIELEKQLVASVEETGEQMRGWKKSIGPAQSNLQFKCEEYITRLLNDVKHYRNALGAAALLKQRSWNGTYG